MDERHIGSRYAVTSPLGQGASGQVWAGHDTDGRTYAIKLLRPELAADSELVNRFVGERSVLQAVRHPHVVQVHDLVVEGATLAIVMDLVEGSDLRDGLRARGTYDAATVARLGAQVAGALAAAHAAQVVHRDVKPENVLLEEASGAAKLSDFGIARIVDSAKTTMMVGTPQYMAPEIAEGLPPVPASDLYSLGVMLYELCCGVPPFAGRASTMATLRAHQAEVPGRPAGIPDVLWGLIATLVEKDPALRGTAAEVEATLTRIAPALDGIPAAPRLQTPPAPERLVTPHGVAPHVAATMAAGPAGVTPGPAMLTPSPMLPAGWVPPPGQGYPSPGWGAAPAYPAAPEPKRGGGLLVAAVMVVALLTGVGGAVWLFSDDEAEAVAADPVAASSTVEPAPAPSAPQPASPTEAPPTAAQPTAAPQVQQAAPPLTVQQPQPQAPAPAVQAAPAPPVEAPTQPVESGRTQEQRRATAESVLNEYLDVAESGDLNESNAEHYFSNRVSWYGAGEVSRSEVVRRSQIDPSKPRTRFTTLGIESFTGDTTYQGQEADVMALRREYRRASGETGRILVTYTLAYDRGAETAPRIASVKERAL